MSRQKTFDLWNVLCWLNKSLRYNLSSTLKMCESGKKNGKATKVHQFNNHLKIYKFISI
jgi:hypothetical protein